MRSGSWAITHRRGGHSGDPAQRPGGIRRVHEEGTGVGEVERPADAGHVELMDVTGDDLDVAGAKDGEHRPGELDRGIAEVDPDDRPARAYQLG